MQRRARSAPSCRFRHAKRSAKSALCNQAGSGMQNAAPRPPCAIRQVPASKTAAPSAPCAIFVAP
eukprot:12444312-Alexandrium_andersonii.AAC.1